MEKKSNSINMKKVTSYTSDERLVTIIIKTRITKKGGKGKDLRLRSKMSHTSHCRVGDKERLREEEESEGRVSHGQSGLQLLELGIFVFFLLSLSDGASGDGPVGLAWAVHGHTVCSHQSTLQFVLLELL